MDVNFLKLPGAVKNVLDKDRVDAEVKGTFYVRDGSGIAQNQVRQPWQRGPEARTIPGAQESHPAATFDDR